MSKCVRSCVCSRLPERHAGLGSRVQRCPQCKKKIGVTNFGERFRFAFARAVPPRTDAAGSALARVRAVVNRMAGARKRVWVIAGGGVFGVFLLTAVTYVARSERPAPPPPEPTTIAAIEPVREGPSPLALGARDVAASLSSQGSSDSFGPATALVRARPREAQGVAKRDGIILANSAQAYALVKHQEKAPRTIAKRIAPPPAGLPTPDWLWTAVRTSEAESLRQVPEIRLHSYRTKPELLRQFKKVVAQHENGSDAFVAALIQDRPDLAGLPFLKGNACRISAAETAALAQASRGIRGLLDAVEIRANYVADPNGSDSNITASDAKEMFGRLLGPSPDETPLFQSLSRLDKTARYLPALLQILGPREPVYRVELARRVAKLPVGDDAVIAALVRLALYDQAADVRAAAAQSLRRQPVAKYGSKLLEGFRHPSPHVAEHAAERS